ncbi:putative spermidine/putrescine transport system ATP-binding protein [Spinactinospora alkalitolerans]|uniref:Spermidine/putrescine import ATP-binding protein PotA n=1 Tax=Spinactinospora alkalitolerans TaxID=687207 RepID=A0A852U117_9ACTN|nr:ABC transporter ATP-binding protein [Spinactinospora alkalitolerans]NYE47874.1 putative spermidine/putrescine transport system ATP-binding protein [Spinactinospora alkalitolerans]
MPADLRLATSATVPADTGAAVDLSGRGAGVRLENITKRFGDFTAIDGVSLDVRPGEFITLLGPSGSGKTTTLNVIAGFTEADAGRLLIDGTVIGSLPTHKRDLGMVFQHYALFPHMTVAANIAYPLKQRRVPKARRAPLVQAALESVRLNDFAHRYPRELSGGQQQRVAVARSIVYRPRVLLMDEPLGALDKKLRDRLQLEIRRIHAELGTTFVYVTHDQDEALVLSDRIAVFNRGDIEQLGTAEELYERPRTLFVARFIGESTVLRGPVEHDGGRPLIGCCGRRLRGEGTLPEGARTAALVIRPERITVREAGQDPTGSHDCALPATVTGVIYLGSGRKLELRLPDGTSALAREQAGRLSGAGIGDEVTLTWSARDAVLLADDSTSEEMHT